MVEGIWQTADVQHHFAHNLICKCNLQVVQRLSVGFLVRTQLLPNSVLNTLPAGQPTCLSACLTGKLNQPNMA